MYNSVHNNLISFTVFLFVDSASSIPGCNIDLHVDVWWLHADVWWLHADVWWLHADVWWLHADVWWLHVDVWWLHADVWWLHASTEVFSSCTLYHNIYTSLLVIVVHTLVQEHLLYQTCKQNSRHFLKVICLYQGRS